MNSLLYLRSRRLWIVPDFTIWGISDEARLNFLMVERIDSVDRVVMGETGLGASVQDISFSDLYDQRGNQLPEEIKIPRVIIRPKSQYNAYLVGNESNTGFRVARAPESPGPIRADFIIFETGEG